MRMDVGTFEYLCATLAPMLQRQDTVMRSAIPVQVKVAVAISRLATGNSMQSLADLYRIGLSSSQLAVSQFCLAMKSLLLKKFIRWPSTAVMDKLAEEFQGIHQIPYVVGVVDGSHIPIVAPRLHAADYYNRKGFHSVLLQGLSLRSAFFGISTLAGLDPCTMRISGHDRILVNFVRLGAFHPMHSLAMPPTCADHGC